MTFVIVLVGLPGSGKTTVGKQLAKRLQLPFVDTDQVIEQRIGCRIREWFERQGETAFRDVEQAVIAELVTGPLSVLSTGGGAVLREGNRQALHASGTVFYLQAKPEDLTRRLKHDRTRPLLQVDDPLHTLQQLFAIRDPLYRQTAHCVLETGRPSVGTLVHLMVRQLERKVMRPSVN